MKVAVVGSRNLSVRDLGDYLPSGTTEIISGGARGVDTSAREYANAHGIPLTEILPDYKKYAGRIAPLKRNIEITANIVMDCNDFDQFVCYALRLYVHYPEPCFGEFIGKVSHEVRKC